MISPAFSRWPYLIAVAIIGATASDLLVEAVSNTGVFGGGFFDRDDSSIVPALVVAVILAAGVIGGHMFAACRRSRRGRRDWLAAVAADVAAHAPLRDLPLILSLQFGALFAMESVEQIAAHGALAGGLSWLGGPVAFSVCAHLCIGVLCTLVAGWLMRVSMPHFASLVRSALEFVLCARRLGAAAVFVVVRDAVDCGGAQAACVLRISGRAPPLLPTPA